MKREIFLLFLLATFGIVSGQTPGNPQLPQGAIQFNAKEIIWKDGPLTLPKGTKTAVLEGNPKEAGLFTMRIELPANSEILTHTHPREERVTVISGMVCLGFGEKSNSDLTSYTCFSEGGYYVNPPMSKHFVRAGKTNAVVQITGMGPWEIHFTDVKK